MNFKYIVAGAASVRAAGSAARLLILELLGELTVENLFTSDHACRPDGTHSRMHIHTRTHTHTFTVCDFPLCSLLCTRVAFLRRKQAIREPSKDVPLGLGVRLDFL